MVAAAEPTHPGRIVVSARALHRVAEQACATTIGVERGDVSVDVAAFGAGLALRVSAPLPVPRLDDTEAIAGSTPVLERLGRIQEELRDRVAHLTGRDVARVDLTITGATIPVRRRVR